jgi:sorting nexin-1/2
MKILVTVTDPQTENEGRRDQFTTYLVSTEKTAVRRRYSDFQWLYGRLQTELPGAIVPIIPHETTFANKSKRFDPRFLEKRRRHLQYFMNAVVNHDELQRAPSMTPFMVDKLGKELDTGKKKVEMENPTSILPYEEDAPSTAKKVSNMFANLRVRAGKKEELAQTPEEQQVESIQGHIAMVEHQVKTLVRSAEAMTQATGQMATVIADMKEPMAEWKTGYQQSIKVSDDICDMMAALLEFTNDYSHLMDHKYREEQIEFEDVMIRLGNDVRSFKIALRQRKHWQVAYTGRSQQIKSKEEQIAKANFSLKPPEVTGKLSFERSELLKRAHAEKAKFEECTTRFLKEVTLSRTRLESQLKEAFRQYAKIQIAYTNRINEAWGQLLPYVGEVQEEEIAQEETTTNGDTPPTPAVENGGDEDTRPEPPSNPPPPPPPAIIEDE